MLKSKKAYKPSYTPQWFTLIELLVLSKLHGRLQERSTAPGDIISSILSGNHLKDFCAVL